MGNGRPKLERQAIDIRRGQAAIEYLLLVAISVLIFGSMFSTIRKSLFVLWVCEITPRVQAPTGCAQREDCYQNDPVAARCESLR
jgi:hypothetical protein